MLQVGARAPLLAQRDDRVEHDLRLLDGVDGAAVAPVRLPQLGVAGAALDRDRRVDRAAAGDPDLEAGRLGDDAGVGAHAVRDARDAARSARLLVGDRVHEQVAARAARRAARASRRPAPSRRRRPSCRTSRGRRAVRRARPACSEVVASSAPCGSTETTSMWPLRSRLRPPPAPAKRASSCGRPAKSSSNGHLAWPARPRAPAPTRRPRRRRPAAARRGAPAAPPRRAPGRPGRAPSCRTGSRCGGELDELVAALGDRVDDALLEVVHPSH